MVCKNAVAKSNPSNVHWWYLMDYFLNMAMAPHQQLQRTPSTEILDHQVQVVLRNLVVSKRLRLMNGQLVMNDEQDDSLLVTMWFYHDAAV